jgi:hypothetical protein
MEQALNGKTKYLDRETDLCTHILVHLFARRSHISETIESRFFLQEFKTIFSKKNLQQRK